MTITASNLALDDSDIAGKVIDLQKDNRRFGTMSTLAVTAVANAAGQTLTAAGLLGGIILRSGAAAVSDTLPTAALIVAAIPNCAVGDTFEFTIQNNNSGLLTIVAGTGNTLSGTTTIANAFSRRFVCKLTNVTAGTEAATIYGISTAAV